MAKKTNPQYTITGTITNLDGQPLANLTVRAFDRDPVSSDDVLGKVARTDAQGKYSITCSHQDTQHGGAEKGGADVYIQVYQGTQLLGQSAVRKDVKQKATIHLKVNDSQVAANLAEATIEGDQRRVYGMIRDALGKPIEGIWVAVYDRDLRHEQWLGEATTKGGKYEVSYTQEQFARAEKAHADIVVKVLDPKKQVLQQSPIYFNAPQALEVNLNLEGIDYQGPSEWETLTQTFTPLLDGISPLELQENKQHQDISFLAGETGQTPLTIGIWAAAHHLADKAQQDKTPLKAMVLYGFLRQGQPGLFYDNILQDIQTPALAELLKEKLLKSIALIPADEQKRLLLKAIDTQLIPLEVRPMLEEVLAILHTLRLKYLAQSSYGGGKGNIGQLLALTPEIASQQDAFLEAYDQFVGTAEDFWAKLKEEKIIEPALLAEVQRNFELGNLTINHLPLVEWLGQQFRAGTYLGIAELAKYDREDWQQILQASEASETPIGIPKNMENTQEYALALEERFEQVYPTLALAGRLQKQKDSPLTYPVELSEFLSRNPEFQLENHRVEHYLRDHPEALKDLPAKEGIMQELKTVQRLFKLKPKFQAVDALLQAGVKSAQQAYFMGKEQLTSELTKAGLNQLDSQQIFHKASNAYAMTLTLVSTYNQALNGHTPQGAVGFSSANLPPEMQLKIDELPNLKALFGSLDYCQCTQCRSVYSPAAYLVDLLHFLGNRHTNGQGINAGKKVKEVLLERRPDLGEIELSCANTNTPLPYIDLVNEILEDVVAPPTAVNFPDYITPYLAAGTIQTHIINEFNLRQLPIEADAEVHAVDSRGYWTIQDQYRTYQLIKVGNVFQVSLTRQTHQTAAELRANPEYTNPQAYDLLAQQVYPLQMPFNLWQEQTQAYLDHLGVPLPELQTLFQQVSLTGNTPSPSQLQIDCASLEINERERLILTQGNLGQQPWDFWGLQQISNHLPHPDKPGDASSNITGTWIEVLAHVPVMLHRAGVTYRELLQLLEVSFIDPGHNVYIFDSSTTNANNCDTNTLRIQGLSTGVLNNLHRFVRLWRKLDCPMWELDRLLAAISPLQLNDATLQRLAQMQRLRAHFDWDWSITQALFYDIDHSIYYDRSQSEAPMVQTLYQRLFRNKLVDAVAPFPVHPAQLSGTIADYVPGILAAYEIEESDLELILVDLGVSMASSLTWATLSQIYRPCLLAAGLRLSIAEFLHLKQLSGVNPFASPLDTWRLVETHQQIKASGWSIAQLNYLLAHKFSPNAGIALEDKNIELALQDIRTELQKISNDVAIKPEETPYEYIERHLALLPNLSEHIDQQTALAIIEGTWTGTTTHRNALINQFFAGVLSDLAVAETNLAELPPTGTGMSLTDRLTYVQTELELYLLTSQKEDFIKQKVANLFQLEVPSAHLLLTKLSLSGVALLAHLHPSNLLSKLPNGDYQDTINEINFNDAYRALRLLHKNALLLNEFRVKGEELAWWLVDQRASDLLWVHPNDFPAEGTATQVALDRWLNMSNFWVWKNTLPLADLTAFDFLEMVLDAGVTDAAKVNALARLTGWNATDLQAMIAAFGWNISQALRKATALQRLSHCVLALGRLGVNAARAIGWAKASPTYDDAESLKQTVKAKYDLGQWQEVIRPLQDQFRTQKRDALVSYLVAQGNPNWMSANALYSYFLIDVEMSACMLTSRIKQASASVQLFVQRCLMNLEKDLVAKTEVDSKWKQWQWMRYYRVWEANRKVFLYPENWLEPELRDEKSPFFKDLEKELMQNDVTHDTAQQAYLNYLEKLDRVANLEIRATHKEYPGVGESVLHVFGRDRSNLSPGYFYRTQINGGRWTAWEKVEADIEGDHLVVGMHNKRLHLLWPQFLEKAKKPDIKEPSYSEGGSIKSAEKYWEIRLFWSELKQGKWSPKVLTNGFKKVDFSLLGGGDRHKITFKNRHKPFIETRIFLEIGKPFVNQFAPASFKGNIFHKIGKQIATDVASPAIEHLITGLESQYHYDLIQHTSPRNYFYYTSAEETGKWHAFLPHENAEHFRLLSSIDPNTSFSVVDATAQGFLDRGSYFFWDKRHTYFVDYEIDNFHTYRSNKPVILRRPQFEFFIHYHPFTELFIKELNIWGIKGLLNRKIQVSPHTIPGSPTLFNFEDYAPTSLVKPNYKMPTGNYVYPMEDVDFSYKGAYAIYNWELFFHAPFHIANKLAANQRFEDALEWFHYIFDPTSTENVATDPDTPQQKYWITKPFYETTKADYYKQKIENLLLAIANNEAEAVEQVREWRDNPFNPHLVARMRTVAYQKNVLIKYIQTLIAWGDQLFRRNSIESINEATQLYVMADSILGPRPKNIPQKATSPAKTFYQLEQLGIDGFSNALVEVENLLPAGYGGNTNSNTPALPRLDLFYFCIPNNDKILSLWDTVADRLFKIRNCMNIEGVVQQLPLFEPPIDPSALIKATAAGLDLGAALNDLNAPLPLYRFGFMVQRALELCAEVKSLGAALLSALEKKDAEALALLRSNYELNLMDSVRNVREKQIEEAEKSQEAIAESRKTIEARKAYYEKLIGDGLNGWEASSLNLTQDAIGSQIATTALHTIGTITSLIPGFTIGAAGFGGTPTATAKFGGREITAALNNAAAVTSDIAQILQMSSGMTATIGGHNRRAQEWEFQREVAAKELPQIDKQVAAAEIRKAIAEQELANHDKQKENLEKELAYMQSKFSNQELYDWMINQLSTLFFQTYQLAYDTAKRAERCFRYELGLSDSSYIQFGYWNSLKKGLLSGEKLHYDLKRLETAYYEQNRREYELTKHISLAQIDPVALMQLRQTGECFVNLPEALFDLDYPGHYFRRLKSVSLSIPCVVGPYSTVACTLTLTSNSLRTDATGASYPRDLGQNDPRFRDEIAAIQSIATSSGQNDGGVFELNFRDERYVPFEGAGAISSWHIKMNKEFAPFDFASINDVVMHLYYTAREGGAALKQRVNDALNDSLNSLALAENREGLFRVYDIKQTFSTAWHQFLHPQTASNAQVLTLSDLQKKLPFFTQQFSSKKVSRIEVVALLKDGAPECEIALSPLSNHPNFSLITTQPSPNNRYPGFSEAVVDLNAGQEVDLNTWTLQIREVGATTWDSFPADNIQELFLVVNYNINP